MDQLVMPNSSGASELACKIVNTILETDGMAQVRRDEAHYNTGYFGHLARAVDVCLKERYPSLNLLQFTSNTENPLEEAERAVLLMALRKNRWNYKRAAEALKLSRSTLYAKANRYGLKREDTDRTLSVNASD